MSLTDTNHSETANFMPKRAIGSFTATVTIEEAAIDELEVTQHPVQQGAEITDHAFKKPVEVTITVLQAENEDEPLSEIYQRIVEMQEKREPLDVVTGKRAYKNMLITSLRQTTDAHTEFALSLTFTLREIIITALEVVTVPERSKQKDPGKTDATKNAGKKQAVNTKQATKSGSTGGKTGATADSTKRRSALAALAGKGGK